MKLINDNNKQIVIVDAQLAGEPFRRDTMKKPVKVAGISKSDMKLQKTLI